jgi:OOP family OmpA-OmpF porin
MFDCFGRKIFIGVVTGTLLSTAAFSVLAADDKVTYHLLDSQENPVLTRDGECVETPNTPNQPRKLFKICGDVIDKDKDGIDDDEDECPDNTPTEISRGVYPDGPYRGCPIDRDNDGVHDYRDNCPNDTPREIENGVYDDAEPLGRPMNIRPQRSGDIGCPVDMDQDGVPDYRDDCSNTPFGLKVNEQGCRIVVRQPERITLSGDVTFAFDKDILTDEAEVRLRELAYDAKEEGRIDHVTVEGYTDVVGTEEYNLDLSQKRADRVSKFLEDEGIPNLEAEGKGESDQYPTHKENRRVEIRIYRWQKKADY